MFLSHSVSSLLILSITTHSQSDVLDSFQCFDNPKIITYANNPNETVANTVLPQIRIMMPGYQSQCALNMVAYLFIKEKLGVNITFYPTTDFDDIWNGIYWDNWNGSNAWPRNYFEWLWQDNMDLNFEFWPTHLIETDYSGDIIFDGRSEYVTTNKIEIGYSGPFVELGIWIPKYFVDQYPQSVLPIAIRHDSTIRQALIAGSRNGTTDYYDAYSSSPIFDGTNESVPIIWGSSPWYTWTQHLFDLKNNAIDGNGMNVSFVATGSESSLFALVSDLYSQRLPFMATIYSTDDNFGRFVNATTTELQRFEKLVFPQNPSQSRFDPCVINATCYHPPYPLMKAVNVLLKSRFPEMYQFYLKYEMTNYDLNRVAANYWNGNASLSNTERWLQAACDHLKSENQTKTTEWFVDIIRYDCPSGCGFAVGNNEFVGGSCNYFTGQCKCDYDELFIDTNCTQSCPGLIGPIFNSTINEYSFQFCSGNGICDIDTRECQCYNGYQGDDCNVTVINHNDTQTCNSSLFSSSTLNMTLTCDDDDGTLTVDLYVYQLEINAILIIIAVGILIILSMVCLCYICIRESNQHQQTMQLLQEMNDYYKTSDKSQQMSQPQQLVEMSIEPAVPREIRMSSVNQVAPRAATSPKI